MSKTTFEKLGIPYEERDGIFYPVLVAGTEQLQLRTQTRMMAEEIVIMDVVMQFH